MATATDAWSEFAFGLPYQAIMIRLSVSRKLALLAALLFSPALDLRAEQRRYNVGAITSALRAREFDKALQLLQPALQTVSEKRATVDTARDRIFRRRT